MALAERTVSEKARAVAKQTGFFLSGQPNLTQKGFNRDLYFKKIVMQDLGLTGYTALYSIPDDRGISSLWVHPDAKLVGIDIKTKLSQTLGENFKRWWQVYQGAFDGKESKGYYQWREPDGRWVEKFMACAPIEGTPYIIAATTNVEEFTIPFLKIQKTATKIADQTKSANTISLSAGLLLIGFLIFFYGRGLTRKIRNLSSAADLISIGELDTQISIKSNDEIGDLAEAISRMQESIRLSIERLRRRK
jgi:HAMP domain-containing protein